MVIHASHRKHTEKMLVLVVTYASYRKHMQKRCPCTLAFVPPQLIKLSIPATICVFKRLSSGKWYTVSNLPYKLAACTRGQIRSDQSLSHVRLN